MKNDEEIVEFLIDGGVVGVALGLLISKNKESGVTLGALAGAALVATYKANEKAKQTKLPMFIEEDGCIFQIQSGGEKKFIKKLEKPSLKLEKNFKLK